MAMESSSQPRVEIFCFAGYVAVFAGVRQLAQHPISVALTWVRTASQRPASGVSSSGVANASTRNVLRQLLVSRGLRGWYVGLPTLVVGASLSEAAYLTQFEYLHGCVGDSLSSKPLLDFGAGFVSEGTRQIVSIPFVVIATRQILSTQPMTSAAALRWVVRQPSRWRGLFAGLGSSLAVGPIWTALWWWAYGISKERLHTVLSGDDSRFGCRKTLIINTAASVLASASTAVMFNPFLVVRTRLQAHPGASLMTVLSSLHRCTGALMPGYKACIRRCRVLMTGTVSTMALSVVDGVGASLTYETAKSWATMA